MGKSTYHIAVLVCAALALAGCNKFDKFEWRSGDTVKFGAGSKGDAMTKTSYGDVYTDGDNKKKQIVNWKADDLIRIACAQASTTEEGTSTIADYKTSPTEIITNTDKSGRKESRATLSLAGNNDKGLRWGSETATHKFYGVYPSPATAGKSGDALSDEGVLSGSIPETQSGTPVSDGKAFVDMTNLYMVAKKTVAAGTQSFGENEVFLYFTPITTAIEFEVTNAMTDDLVIDNIELISTNHHLSGGFETDLSEITDEEGYDYPDVDAASGAGNNAKVSFGTSGLTLQNNEKLTFTIFLLPEDDLDDLTFRINRKGVGAGYIQTALKWVLPGETDATFIEFDRCKKHFVKGLFANEGAKWTVCFDPDLLSWSNQDYTKYVSDPSVGSIAGLIPWDNEGDITLHLTPEPVYDFRLSTAEDATQIFDKPGNVNSKTIHVLSTKDGTSHGWKIKKVNGVPVDGTECTLDALHVEMVANGSDFDLELTDQRTMVDLGDTGHWTTSDGFDNRWYSSWHTTGVYDLSKYDFMTDTRSSTMITSNCYVIRHACFWDATYRIPLVYGNAIDFSKNSTNGYNTAAYAPGGSGANTLGTFFNHLGFGIVDPYIENNRTDGKNTSTDTKQLDNKRLKAVSADIIWQDHAEVKIEEITVHPYTKETDNTLVTKDTRGYISFKVGKVDIHQCNAILAVRDGGGNIMWSWHLWITNDPVLSNSPVSVKNADGNTYNFFPSPCIGWIEPPFYEYKDPVTIVLEQEDSDMNCIEIVVLRPLHQELSNGTYYQWGRKDPMLPGISTTVSGTGKTLGDSIKEPNKFYTGDSAWCGTFYYNLWSGTYSGIGYQEQQATMIKTVYDPSPRGYKVPAPMAFSGFTNDNVAGPYRNGYYFYTVSGRGGGDTIFFPSTGYDARSSGAKITPERGYFSACVPALDIQNSILGGSNFRYYDSTKEISANSITEGFNVRPVTE